MANKTLRIEFTHAKNPAALLPWPTLRGDISLDLPALANVLNAFAAGLLPGTMSVALGETAGVRASQTIDVTDTEAADTVTINGVTFTAVTSGASTDEFNIDGEHASGTATFSSVIATDIFTVNGEAFTCVASGATGDEFDVGASDEDTAINAAAAINASVSVGVAGLITATAVGAVVVLTSDLPGVVGNAYTLATSDATIVVSGATLTGGDCSGANLAAAINASATSGAAGYIRASASGSIVTVEAFQAGLLGNLIALTEVGSMVLGGATLAGGAGGDVTPTVYSKT